MYITEVIRTIYNTNGKLTIQENKKGYKTLRPFNKVEYNIYKKYIKNSNIGMKPVTNLKNEVKGDYEYQIYLNEFKKYDGMVLNNKIIQECKNPKMNLINEHTLKRYDKKRLLELLKEVKGINESDVKVKNPETGKEILATSALSAGPSHPAYKAAKAALAGSGDSSGEQSSKQDDSSPHKDSGEHGDSQGGHGGHGPAKSPGQRLAAIGVDLAMKITHIDKIHQVAGVFGEKIVSGAKNLADKYKGAEGEKVIDKLKNVSKEVKGDIKKWSDDKKAAFASSMVDEATGQRKSMGKMLTGKLKGFVEKAKDGIVAEAKHIGHGLKEGGEFLKKAVTDPKNLTTEDWNKAVSGIESVAHVGIIVAAVAMAHGGLVGQMTAIGAKAGGIAAREGALTALMTSHVYTDLQRKGLLKNKIVNEHNGRLLNIIVEKEVNKIDDDTFLTIGNQLIGDSLQSDDTKPQNLDEDNMKDLVRMSDEMYDLGDNASKVNEKDGGDDTKKVQEQLNKVFKKLSKFKYVEKMNESEYLNELKTNKLFRETILTTFQFLKKQTKKKNVGK